MIRPKIARTAIFQLALIYALVFGLSTLLLFGFLYWRIAISSIDQRRTLIRSEATRLLSLSGGRATAELARAIDARASAAESSSSFYALQNPSNVRIAGNLAPMPAQEGFSERNVVPLRPDQSTRVPALIYGTILPDGSYLVVGEDLEHLKELNRLIEKAFGIAIAATVALAIAGGIATSRSFLRRIDAINRVSETIVRGDLSKRLPVGRSDDEIDQLAKTFNRMLDQVAYLMEGLRQVSSDIAHDLRTPLSRLRQRLERARSAAPFLADRDVEIGRAIADVDAILATFAALLRIAQIESGSRRSAFQTVDLSALFNDIVEVFGPVAEDDGQHLSGDIEAGITTWGDRELLTQMLANLVENALRHAGGAPVTLSLRRDRAQVIGIVGDHGPGIPEVERDKVFRRFYRLERSRTNPGSGLGLALVGAVAEAHSIHVSIEDNNPGCRVRLVFAPFDQLRADHASPAAARSRGALPGSNCSGTPSRPVSC